MDLIGERAKLLVKQVRYSWALLTFILAFVFILWTFQLALIVRFQTSWPSGGTICFSDQQDTDNDMNYDVQGKSHSRFSNPQPKIVCYYVLDTNFSSNDYGTLNINPFLCSHINVGFANVVNGSIVPRDLKDFETYKDIINLKDYNPSLKILLSVQEYSFPNCEFCKVVSSGEQRKKFSKNVVEFLSKYKFDGLDIDWEFPSWPTSDPDQKRNFTLLLREINSSIRNDSSNLTLSVAVGAPAAIFLQCYEISEMAKYVDWINLMSYDYHLYNKLTPTTGPNAPLYPSPQDSTFLATLNTNWSVAHWVFWGMPKDKIIIGIPTYGHSFKLLNPDNNGWYAPAVGFGSVGEAGFIVYPDACKLLSEMGSVKMWDPHYKVPYAFYESEWISYENKKSVRLKAELVMKGGYGGAMIFSLNTDDSKGLCRQGSFPLTSSVHAALRHALYTSS